MRLEMGDVLRLTVDKRHARTILAALADTLKVAIQELITSNLQTLLDDLGSILIHAVLGSETQDVVDGTATIGRSAVLTDMLDAPVTELAVGDNIDAGEHFVDAGTLPKVSRDSNMKMNDNYLVLLETVLEDVLHHQTARLAECNFVPHPTESFVDVAHYLGR